ncbi:MerR family transcriptional regulator [Microbacterium maritypicum]|uniref:MerR family transcriptional regulator n=1 Tax=Microbacterium maritypicum TaxID=33918 RepID=UPI002671E482|nr:MerR family transcriptional regulator [Microbacterium liquefaciens]WKT87701.1 MerR family transcriptional regulator [Microbacterium liquefaciens]
MHASDPTMHIGELADQTGLSLRTIRHYDEIGLLKPSGRSEGGFRLYTQPDLERLLLIRRMKPLGFALEEMIDLLSIMEARATSSEDDADVAAKLDQYLSEARERREKLRSQLEMADEFVARLERL